MAMTDNEIKAVRELAAVYENCTGECHSCEFNITEICVPKEAHYLKKRRQL